MHAVNACGVAITMPLSSKFVTIKINSVPI